MTMNNLNLITNAFQFAEREVRTAIGADGEVWFCAKDVYEVLGIVWKGTSGSMKNVPKKWQGVCYCQTPGGGQEVIFISEPAVYQTIFASRKPEAQAFAGWVCGEVLPAIRKQGFFGTVPGPQRAAYSRQIAKLTQQLVGTKDAFARQLFIGELRDLCNLVGRPMPDLALLGKDHQQLPLGV